MLVEAGAPWPGKPILALYSQSDNLPKRMSRSAGILSALHRLNGGMAWNCHPSAEIPRELQTGVTTKVTA